MRKIEIKEFVKPEQLAEQLALTNRSAAVLVTEVGAAHAMTLMQIFEGQTIRFPYASTVLKAAIVAYIRKEIEGTLASAALASNLLILSSFMLLYL